MKMHKKTEKRGKGFGVSKNLPTFAPAKKIRVPMHDIFLKFFRIKFGGFKKIFYLCNPFRPVFTGAIPEALAKGRFQRNGEIEGRC